MNAVFFAIGIAVSIIFWVGAVKGGEPEETIISWIASFFGWFALLAQQPFSDGYTLQFFAAIATVITNLPFTLIAWSKRKKIDEKYKR